MGRQGFRVTPTDQGSVCFHGSRSSALQRGSGASVPIPKFASVRGDLCANFGIDKDTSKTMMLVPLLNPKFATVPAAKACELRVRGTSARMARAGLPQRGREACFI